MAKRSRPGSPLPQEGARDLVLLGEFGRPQGLRGEVRVKSYTADPQAIAAYGPLLTDDGRSLVLAQVRSAGAAPDLLVARVDGIADRAAAEALTGRRLFVARDRLPPPEDDEFLLADLVGLSVETAAGDLLGTVAAVPNYGGGDLLEIRPADGGTSALLPFTKAFVPVVDLARRRIVIDPPPDLFAAAEDRPG